MRERKNHKRPGLKHLFLWILPAMALVLCCFSIIVAPAFGDSVFLIDTSSCDDGAVNVKAAPSSSALKLLIRKGDVCLTEYQNSIGAWQLHRLYLGAGLYTFTLCENISGNQYGIIAQQQVYVASDCMQNWLQPNEHVVFGADSSIVEITNRICTGKSDQADVFRSICNYLEKNYAFDYIASFLAPQTEGEILPDIDGMLEKRMGICKDFSSAAVAMLRSQGIPAVMMVGYADGVPHAWVLAEVNGVKKSYDPTVKITGGSVQNYKLLRMY